MESQLSLDLPMPVVEDVVVVNERCQVRKLGDHRVIVVSGMPLHRYMTDDAVGEAYAMVLLADSGFALQREVAVAFGRCERTVRRYQARYSSGGMAALAVRSGWRPGRRRVSRKRLLLIERCKAEGMSNRAIARRIGVSEGAIRKLVGPEETPKQSVIAFPKPVSPQKEPEAREKCTADVSEAEEESTDAQDEVIPMSLDVDPGDRSFDRLLACFGLIDDAAPLFGNAVNVPGAGVLFAVPCLLHSGLFSIARKLYGEIGPAFYGLRTTLLALLLMALLRVKRAEALKERDPAVLGRLMGLDRAPEVKSLRRKLARLAARHQSERLAAELARRRVELRGQALGFLYVDGHVRVYHGKRTLPKTHVTRLRLALPATTDYWVNDPSGDPLLVITAQANAGLVKMMPRVTAEIRELVGDRRVTVVFDRGGWSPELFKRLISDGFDVLTYRKFRCPPVAEECFVRRQGVVDGHPVDYRLHDQEAYFLKGKFRLRQVTRLCGDGHQTQVITSRWDLEDYEVAFRMFERWRQENFFKYMREEYLLDALVDYQIEPDDPSRTVPNPVRKAIDVKIRATRAEIAALEQDYGKAALDNPESQRPTMRGFKSAHGKIGMKLRAARQHLDDLLAQRCALPARVELRAVSASDVIKLATERKHLTDVLKMVAYQAESDLLALLCPHYARAHDEGRTLLHEIFATAGDFQVTDEQLQITLSPLSSPHRTLAVRALCDSLNKTASIFPGTKLRLVFAVRDRQSGTMAFPGHRPQTTSQHQPSPPQPDISHSD